LKPLIWSEIKEFDFGVFFIFFGAVKLKEGAG